MASFSERIGINLRPIEFHSQGDFLLAAIVVGCTRRPPLDVPPDFNGKETNGAYLAVAAEKFRALTSKTTLA